MTLEEFAKYIELDLDRPVVNQTGIAGRFDFRVEFTPDESTPGLFRPQKGNSPEPAAGQTFRDAMQDQLGLRLESAGGPGTFLVIDHLEKLKEN